jgi:hypothetical protein
MTSFMYNFIGLLGDVFILIAYILLQLNKLKAEAIMYSFLNMIGAVFILFSLYFAWNFPAVVIESAWVLISFYGTIQALAKRSRNT